MFNFRRFLSRRWLLAVVGTAALVFGLLMLHPYPRQSLFEPTIRGQPWCVWEAEVRRYARDEKDAVPTMVKVMAWLDVQPKNLNRVELFNNEEMVPLLVHLLDDPDPNVRYWCLLAFGDMKALKDERAMLALRRRLELDTGADKHFAARAIWHINKDKSVIPIILIHLEVGRTDVERMLAVEFLCNSDMCDQSPELFPHVAAYSRDRSEYVRMIIMATMRRFGAMGVPILIEGLTDADYDVRCWAVGALDLLDVRPKEAVPVLIEQLSDKNDDLGPFAPRHSAAQMLGRWGIEAKAAIPALEMLLNDPDQTFHATVIDALLAIDPKRFQHLKADRKIE